jgi:endonuclease G
MLIDQNELLKAIRARDRAAAVLLFDSNVSLIDIGLKIEGERLTEIPCVRVHRPYKPLGLEYEEYKTRNPTLEKDQIGYELDIIQASYRLHWYWYPPQQQLARAQVYNPLQGGISISNEWSWGYGTVGGLVRDRETGQDMILSNWHVLAGWAYIPEGLRILQPGQGDGGRIRHVVARLSRHAMNDGIDAAVATLTGARPMINHQLGLGPVTGVTMPTTDMLVTKSGRTSEITEGIITGIEGLKAIPYGGFSRIVKHIIHIAQAPEGGNVSAPGDSGSWWLEKGTNKAVGLHFAGADLPEYALAISMPYVLDALNIDI